MNDRQVSSHVYPLVKLLMMLPDPRSQEYESFWEQVSEEATPHISEEPPLADPDYFIKRLVHALGTLNGKVSEVRLAETSLMMFGQASPALERQIAAQIVKGSDDRSIGQMWVQRLRERAFAVLEGTYTDEDVNTSFKAWVSSQ